MNIQFKTDNAAFEGCVEEESARILIEIAKLISEGRDHGVIFDANGNRVGTWTF